MIKLHEHGVYLSHENGIVAEKSCSFPVDKESARKGTISGQFCRPIVDQPTSGS